MQNLYDVAPLSDKGDPEDGALYEAVGRALTQWETLEGILAEIFGLLCGANLREGGAIRAYGVVSAFTGRKDMLDAAFEVCPLKEGAEAATLPALLKRAKMFSARRNEIAHGVVLGVTDKAIFRGYYLVPAHYNSRKRNPVFPDQPDFADAISQMIFGKYAYTANQIDGYREQFFHLTSDASRIAQALFSARLKQGKH